MDEIDLRNAKVWGAFQAWADGLRRSTPDNREKVLEFVGRRLLLLADELYPAKTPESAIEEARRTR